MNFTPFPSVPVNNRYDRGSQAECSIAQYAERLANGFHHARTVRQLKHELQTQTTMMLMSQRTPKARQENGDARQENGDDLRGDNKHDHNRSDQEINVATASVVWHLRHCFGPFLTNFCRIFAGFLSSLPPRARHVIRPTLALSNHADRCVESDVMANQRLQGRSSGRPDADVSPGRTHSTRPSTRSSRPSTRSSRSGGGGGGGARTASSSQSTSVSIIGSRDSAGQRSSSHDHRSQTADQRTQALRKSALCLRHFSDRLTGDMAVLLLAWA